MIGINFDNCNFKKLQFKFEIIFWEGLDFEKTRVETINKTSKTKPLIKLVHLPTLQKYDLKKWIFDDSICC